MMTAQDENPDRTGSDTETIVMAQIGAPHGVRGEVRLKVFAEDAGVLPGLGLSLPDGRPMRITHLRALKGEMFVARLDGVSDRDAAEALRLKRLTARKADLPPIEDEDTFYIADLVGLEVRDEAGTVIGAVHAVHDFGAGDILEVRGLRTGAGAAADAFHPFTRETVPHIALEEGWLTLRPETGDTEEIPQGDGAP